MLAVRRAIVPYLQSVVVVSRRNDEVIYWEDVEGALTYQPHRTEASSPNEKWSGVRPPHRRRLFRSGDRASNLKGIRVYRANRTTLASEVQPPASPRKYWGRRGLAEWLAELLLSGETPTLVGQGTVYENRMAFFCSD